MDSAILKYDLLNSFEKKQVQDFIDFLFSKKKDAPNSDSSSYKNKILNVSTWSNEELKVFDENAKFFDQWHPTAW